MKRRLLPDALFAWLGIAVAAGCSSGPSSAGDPGGTSGASASGGPADPNSNVGSPCRPQQENDPTFSGFSEQMVSVERSSPTYCRGTVCLINHFRGRVSCPYGQSATGTAPTGTQACVTPENATPVTGSAGDPKKATVSASCYDRRASQTVYCSCRCANTNGRTDDGATYCPCPDGFSCTPLIVSIGASSQDIAGSYCVKMGTLFDRSTACTQGDCDPVAKKCE